MDPQTAADAAASVMGNEGLMQYGGLGVVIAAVIGFIFLILKVTSNKPTKKRKEELDNSTDAHGAVINDTLKDIPVVDADIAANREKADNLVNTISQIIEAGNQAIEIDTKEKDPKITKIGIENKWKDM